MLSHNSRSLLGFLIWISVLALCFAYKNETSNQDETVKKWISLRRSVLDLVESLVKRMLPTALSMSYETDISTECMASLLKMLNGVRGLKKWAVSMLDASGKIVPGFFSGSLTDLGDYDLCVSLNDEGKFSSRTLEGQYCTVNVILPLPQIPRKLHINSDVINLTGLIGEDEVFGIISKWAAVFYRSPIRAGVCVPSTCSAEDLKKIGDTVVLRVLEFPEVGIEVPHCETRRSWEITSEQVFVLSFFSVVLLLTAICTIVDVVTKHRNPTPHFRRHFLHFSLSNNAECFFGQEERASGGHLQVLDGIRWWSIAWICWTHTYGLISLSAIGKLLNYWDFLIYVSFGVISSAWVSVDVFFLIGGLLVAYTTLGQLQRENGRMNFLKNIFRRLWRLTPAVLAVIGLVFLLPFLGSGPLWNETVDKQVQLCKDSWWLAALYANAWLGHAQACLVSTWYVSADLHLYVISPIFIYAFYKSKPVGVTFCLVAILASCIALYVLNVQYDLYPYVMMMTFNEATTEDVFTTVYFRPYAHVGPYMVGILLGCFFKSYPKVTARWYTVLGGWCVSITLALCVLIGPYRWVLGELPSSMVSALFQAVHKTAFALSVGWVIWASYYGYAGLVSSLLSWSGYRKLTQLVYLIYLVQLPVLWVRLGNLRKTMVASHYNFFTEFLGIFVISGLVALVLHLLIEAPFTSLDSAMFPKPHKKSKPDHIPNGNGTLSFQEREKECTIEPPVDSLKINHLPLNTKL